MLTKKQKINTIKGIARHEKDTGSAETQIALLTRQISELQKHLKKHRQDVHSRRGLLKMVSNRKKFLNYLSKNNKTAYDKVIKKLGLKRK